MFAKIPLVQNDDFRASSREVMRRGQTNEASSDNCDVCARPAVFVQDLSPFGFFENI